MLTRDACRTTPESFGVRRIACIVPVWATTQRTLLTCGAPLPNEAALQAAKKRGQRPGDPGIAEAAKLGRAALKANARRFAANLRPIIDEIMRACGVHMHDPTLKSTNATCWKTRFFRYLFFHSDEICSVRVRLTTADPVTS